MKTHLRLIVLGILALSLFATGCESVRKRTRREDVRTGLFGNDPKVLATQFEVIVRGKTRAEVEKIGFDLKAKNVQIFTGLPAIRELFGQDAFRNSLDVNNFDKRLPEYNRYALYQVPYKDTLVTSDRIYLSKKTTTTVGWDIVYSVVLYDDVVIYAAPRIVYLDKTEVDKAFLRGIIEFFGEFGSIFSSLVK